MSVPAIGASGKSMAVRSGLGGVLKGAGGVFHKSLLNRRISRASTERAVDLRLGPLTPMIVTAAALLYQQGAESAHAAHGQKTHPWARMLLESAVGHWVIENTSGVYPLWGLVLSTYRAGKKDNLLEKAQAVVETLMTLGLGFAGVHFMAGMSEMALELEDQELLGLLQKPGMRHWADWLDSSPDEESRALGQSLKNLKAALQAQQHYGTAETTPSWDAMVDLRQRVGACKADAFARWRGMDDVLARASGPKMRALQMRLREGLVGSQDGLVRLSRGMNPWFGYILGGLLLGSVAARAVNRQLEARFPQWKTMTFHDLFNPETTLMPSRADHGPSGGGHGKMLPGPALVWPGAGKEVMQ